jgi:hypothetical protein
MKWGFLMDNASTLIHDSAQPHDGAQPGNEKPGDSADSGRQEKKPGFAATTVAQIRKGATDSRGELIEKVFFKRSDYAIYLSDGEVIIQYSDDETRAKQQIDATSELIPLRDKLRFMIKGRRVPGCYRGHVADAFRLILEGKPLVAEESLTCAIEDMLSYKARVGRTSYLGFAGPLAFVVCVALLAVGALAFSNGEIDVGRLLLAASGGAMGALLSIAIALRTRTVAVDDDTRANWLDGGLRVFIGTISGGALMLVLVTGVVASIGMTTIAKDTTADHVWQVALIVGFAAGFFERLVPDLLAKSFDSRPKVAVSPPPGQPSPSS